VNLQDVILSDPLVDKINCQAFDGTLSPGESVKYTATYTIKTNDVQKVVNTTGTINSVSSPVTNCFSLFKVTNTAKVTALGTNGQHVSDTASVTVKQK